MIGNKCNNIETKMKKKVYVLLFFDVLCIYCQVFMVVPNVKICFTSRILYIYIFTKVLFILKNIWHEKKKKKLRRVKDVCCP